MHVAMLEISLIKSIMKEIYRDGIIMVHHIRVRDINEAGMSFAELSLKWVGQALSKTSAQTHKSPAHNLASYHPQNPS